MLRAVSSGAEVPSPWGQAPPRQLSEQAALVQHSASGLRMPVPMLPASSQEAAAHLDRLAQVARLSRLPLDDQKQSKVLILLYFLSVSRCVLPNNGFNNRPAAPLTVTGI